MGVTAGCGALIQLGCQDMSFKKKNIQHVQFHLEKKMLILYDGILSAFSMEHGFYKDTLNNLAKLLENK